MIRLAWRVAALVAASAVLVACSGDKELNQIDFDTILVETSDYQRAVLEDRTLTPDQYEKAIFATWDCVKAGGFDPDEPGWDRGQLAFSNELTAPTEGALQVMNDQYDKVLNECENQYSSEIGQVWAFQQVMTQEEKDRVRPEIVACLQSNGIEIKSSAKDSEVYEALTPDEVDAWAPCIEESPGYVMYIPESGD